MWPNIIIDGIVKKHILLGYNLVRKAYTILPTAIPNDKHDVIQLAWSDVMASSKKSSV